MKNISVSIIIPVADDSRNDFLASLLKSLETQDYPSFEVILVIADKRQGRAINYGVSQSKAKWIVTMDDDTQVFDDSLLTKLVKAMEDNPTIGMGGAACHIPESASAFQKKAMKEIPRRYFPLQQDHVDSDFVQHPCLIIERSFFLKIGGEDEELIRGLDPALRQKVRGFNKRVTIIANTSVAHLLPDGFIKVFNMYRRNGRGSVFAHRFYSDRIYELTDGYDKGNFVEKRPLSYRVIRKLAVFVTNFIKANWIRQAMDIAYILGWIEGWLVGQFPEGKAYIEHKEEDIEKRSCYDIRKFRVTYMGNSIQEQIARMHVNSSPEFVLSQEPHQALEFYQDKVGLFYHFAGEGFLYETNDKGEVLGFIFVLISPKEFKRKLLTKGYGFRYLAKIISGRYKGSPEGWKKWLRLPFAFIQNSSKTPGSGGSFITSFVVREDLRGQKIGSKLLQRAESYVLNWGSHHLAVTVNVNNEGAKRIYERNGFEVSDKVMESTGDSWYLEKSVGVP